MIKSCFFITKLLFFVFVWLWISYLIIPGQVFAHLPGQPPYFKINGTYTSLYPVPTTSLEDFNLPQDIAPANYVVGDKIEMLMDTSQLPAPPEVIADTHFYWNYGDNTSAEGLQNSHIYKKPGSYLFTMDAKYQDTERQFLQSVLINVLPSKQYKLPLVELYANGQMAKDPLMDVLKFDLRKPIVFEAKTDSKNIVEYTWDFGDGETGPGQKVTHQYESGLSQIFPVVRIKTKDGFITHDYIQINNDPNVKTSISNMQKINFWKSSKMLILFSILTSIFILFFLYKIFKRLQKR